MRDQPSTIASRSSGEVATGCRPAPRAIRSAWLAFSLALVLATSSAWGQNPVQPQGGQLGNSNAPKSQSYEVGHFYLWEWLTVALFSGLAIFAVGRSSRRN